MPRKDPDYSKLKALHDSILNYIGDAKDVGEDPKIPKPESNKGNFDDAGTSDMGQGDYESQGDQEPLLDFVGNELGDGKDEQGETPDEDDSESKKKRKDSSLAMMGSMLASKMKGNEA